MLAMQAYGGNWLPGEMIVCVVASCAPPVISNCKLGLARDGLLVRTTKLSDITSAIILCRPKPLIRIVFPLLFPV